MDEALNLRRLLEEERRRRKEAESRIVEAESRVLEAESRMVEAETAARASQPQALREYLEACHSLHLAIHVVKDPSSTTQGAPTDPTGRIFPRRIVPWQDFAARQESVWNRLSVGRTFSSQLVFPSPNQMQYVASVLYPISSEVGLRDFEHDAVENAVRKLFNEAYSDPELRTILELRGSITFESHTNLGTEEIETLSQSMQRLKVRRRARGKGNRADQFCVCKDAEGQSVPIIAIEYKPPHKVGQDEIITGLRSEIQPERDLIHKAGEGYEFASRRLAAAVITQLFSYMIGKGVQYGYVCTGEVFIFLYIPQDPATVYYHVSIPSLDVSEEDENRLHRTAVAQVFAFTLQAAGAEPPPESWHDAAAGLDTWEVEVDDVLKDIKETPSPKKSRASPLYKAQRWRGFKRSPIRTRASCKQPLPSLTRDNGEDDDGSDGPPSPSPNPPHPAEATAISTPPSVRQGQSKQQAGKPRIQDRAYCTQKCLVGLARGGPMDTACPNRKEHGRNHIDQSEFLRLIRHQLATDRGRDADCAPLYMVGALGALFKVRLSSHGYTFVAKGMEHFDRKRLQHEHTIYSRLRPIQGEHLPVCLGMIDLVLPYYYDHGVYTHFLFLSWGGLSLAKCIGQVNKAEVLDAIGIAYERIHQLRVLHLDAEPRNILYNTQSRSIMVIDFERARAIVRQPFDVISPNRPVRRGQKDRRTKKKNEFTEELQLVIGRVSEYFDH
ncbi:hypothetical protein F4679DRAFT_544171 [Xylaria curta]|nr:hypothetical protein F4679DRAFT_544171 [Xylaria curta]